MPKVLRTLYLTIILLFFLSCNTDQKVGYFVPEEKKDAQRAWILECIEKANPRSDEEPEDWIVQCEDTSLRLYGNLLRVKYTDRSQNVRIDSLEVWGER